MSRKIWLGIAFAGTLAIACAAPGLTKTAASGQLPAPSIFEPGNISGPANDGAPTFSPDGRRLYFSRSVGRQAAIYESRLESGRWSIPQVAAFSGNGSDQHPALSPDGRYLIYASRRALSVAQPGAAPRPPSHLWRVDRTAQGWSEPVELPSTVNISDLLFRPSIAANGDLYFMSAPSSGPLARKWRLFRAAAKGGGYAMAEPLPFSDGRFVDVDPYVAPDQSYVIFSSVGRRSPDDTSEHLYVVLRRGSGWGPVQPLRYAGDDQVADDGEANVEKRTQRLFFTSSRSASPGTSAGKGTTQSSADPSDDTNVWSLPLNALFRANGINRPR